MEWAKSLRHQLRWDWMKWDVPRWAEGGWVGDAPATFQIKHKIGWEWKGRDGGEDSRVGGSWESWDQLRWDSMKWNVRRWAVGGGDGRSWESLDQLQPNSPPLETLRQLSLSERVVDRPTQLICISDIQTTNTKDSSSPIQRGSNFHPSFKTSQYHPKSYLGKGSIKHCQRHNGPRVLSL